MSVAVTETTYLNWKLQVPGFTRRSPFKVDSSICFGWWRLCFVTGCLGPLRLIYFVPRRFWPWPKNRAGAPPPTSTVHHLLRGPSPASELCYWTPEFGPLVSKQAKDHPVSPMSAEEGWSSTVTDWLFINSWWLLLPFTMLLVVAAFIVAFVLLLYMISPLISPKPLKLNGAHVVVSQPSAALWLSRGSTSTLCCQIMFWRLPCPF